MTKKESTLLKLRALSREVESLRLLVIASKDPELTEQMKAVLMVLFSITIEMELDSNLYSSAA